MKLAEARDIVRAGVMNTNLTETNTPRLDQMIQFILELVIEKAKVTRRTDTAPTVTDAAGIDITAQTNLANFLPATMTRNPRISYDEVEHKSFDTVRRKLASDTSTGQPTMIAWDSDAASGFLYPIPDAVYTISFAHAPELISWIPGINQPDGDDEEVTLNIPDRILRPALVYGVASALVYHQQEANPWAIVGDKLFKQWLDELPGMIDPDSGAEHDQDEGLSQV